MLKSKNDQGMIENKLIWYQKYDTFETERLHGSIDPKSIVFVAEGRTENEGPFIYTHGYEFSANSISNYVHNTVEGDINNISQALSDQLAELRSLIETEHAGITDGARERLDTLLASLAAAELTINYLLEHGSDNDKTEYLIGILNSELGKINNILVEYRERISAVEGLYLQLMSATDIKEKIQSEYERIINLAKGFVQEEFRKMNLDEQIVQTVGRYMLSGLLKDYVIYALLGDTNTITSLAELLLKSSDTFASLEDIVSWRNDNGENIIEALAALKLLAESTASSWLLTAEYLGEDGKKNLASTIFGYAGEDDEFIRMISSKIIVDTSKFLFRTGNNCISITDDGIRLWVDEDGDGVWDSTEYSNFFLGSNGEGYIGKKGKDKDGNDAYPILWWPDGTVKVQSVTIDGADLNVSSYKPEHRFARVAKDDVPSDITKMLPDNNSDPNADDISKVYNGKTYKWSKNAMNGATGEYIFMIIRSNKVDSDENIKEKGVWQGPYRISGEDGQSPGSDSVGINFVYSYGTKDKPNGIIEGLTSTNFASKGWKNNASEVQIADEEGKRYSWMAFSTTKNEDDIYYNYTAVLWSVWGSAGIDGDGVEYIFCKTRSNVIWETNEGSINPSTWDASDTDEYIDSDYKTNTPNQYDKWYDDPQKLSQGDYQWVSKRSYTWPVINGVINKNNGKHWTKYSTPSLWAYSAKDGVTSGYVVGVDNPSIALSVNTNGFLQGNDGSAVPNFVRDITWEVYKSGASASGQPEYVSTSDANVDTLLEAASTSSPKYTVVTSTEVVENQPAGARPEDVRDWYTTHIIDSESTPSSETPKARLTIVNYNEVRDHRNATDEELMYIYRDASDERLNLLHNNVIVTLTFTIYEAYDSLDHTNDVSYTFVRTFYVYGVHTGANGQPGKAIDLKTSTPCIYYNVNTGAKTPDKIYVWASVGEGDSDPQLIYPNDREDFVFKYITGTTLVNPAFNNSSLSTVDNDKTYISINNNTSTPISIYLFINRKLADWKEIGVVDSGSDGNSGVGCVVSTIYCRTNVVVNRTTEKPQAPIGGTYDSLLPTDTTVKYNGNGIRPMNDDGTFMTSGPYQLWQDGIPAGDEILWESRYTFRTDVNYGDGTNDTTLAEWTEPRQVVDIKGKYDVEFAFELDTYSDLVSYNISDNKPDDHNRHGGDGVQIWFDPKDDEVLPEGRDWTNVVWRAERYWENGKWEDWTILRIKGEKGDPSNGYRLEPSRDLVLMSYSKFGYILLSPTDITFTLYKNGEITTEEWTLQLNTIFAGNGPITISGHQATVSYIPENSGSNLPVAQFEARNAGGDTLAIVEITLQRSIVDDYQLIINTDKIVYNVDRNSYSPGEITIRVNLTNSVTGETAPGLFSSDASDYTKFNVSSSQGSVGYSYNNEQATVSLSGVSYNDVAGGVNIEIYRGSLLIYQVSIPVEHNASTAGTPGKMFYMLGEYTESLVSNGSGGTMKKLYESTPEYIPLVYFVQYGETSGSWYKLVADNNKLLNDESKRYAPGFELSTLSNGKYVIHDRNNNEYETAAGIWEKAEHFDIVISEAIFSDFAKLGSGIVSGDFIMSQEGVRKIYSGSRYGEYENSTEYEYFSPDTIAQAHVNDVSVGGNLILAGYYVINNEFHFVTSHLPQVSQADRLESKPTFKIIDLFIPNGFYVCVDANKGSNDYRLKQKNGDLYYDIFTEIGGTSTLVRCKSSNVEKSSWYTLYLVENFSNDGTDVFDGTVSVRKDHSGTQKGVFIPTWAVDLKTGAVRFAKGVISKTGEISLNGGTIDIMDYNTHQAIIMHSNTNTTLDHNTVLLKTDKYSQIGSVTVGSETKEISLYYSEDTNDPKLIFKDGTNETVLNKNNVDRLLALLSN